MNPFSLGWLSDRIKPESMIGMTRNTYRLQIMPKELSGFIKPILSVIKNQLAKLDDKLAILIEKVEEYRVKNDIIQSMPGVGKVISMSLLSDMPELGLITNKEAAALVGVAPINRESGRYKGQRRIKGGRYQIRTVIFMFMLSAIQCNPLFKATYLRLVEAGKPKKITIIACVRKMIVILNSMMRDGVYWNENMSKNHSMCFMLQITLKHEAHFYVAQPAIDHIVIVD